MTTFVEEISTKLTFVKARRRPQTIFESMAMLVAARSRRCGAGRRRKTSRQAVSAGAQRIAPGGASQLQPTQPRSARHADAQSPPRRVAKKRSEERRVGKGWK